MFIEKRSRMKFIIIIATSFLLLLSTLPSTAQEQGNDLFLGFKGGVTVSDLDFDNSDINELFDSKTAISGGLLISHSSTNRLKLQVEINYVRRGVKNEIIFMDADGQEQSRDMIEYLLDYIEMPIMIVVLPIESFLLSVESLGCR